MYQQTSAPQVGEGNTGTFNMACLNRVERMCNRREEGEIDKYFIAFRYALFFVISSIPAHTKQKIIGDFAKLDQAIRTIELSQTIAEQTKRAEILNLKRDFAETHEYHIFDAFSRIGILHITDEGALDFTKRDIDKLRTAVSGAQGTPSAIKAIAKEEKVEEVEKHD